MSRQGRKRKRGEPAINEPRMFHPRESREAVEEEPRFPSAQLREGLQFTPEPSVLEMMVKRAMRGKKRKKKKLRKLPNELFHLPNPDKEFHEKWYPGRNLLDFPHPFRLTACSKPHGGKTTAGKHVIMRVGEGRRPFERIFVVHCDKEGTMEYDDLDVIMLDHIPSPGEFPDDGKKTLVILEDLDYVSMSKQQQGNLERLFGYVSTHLDVSVMLTAQNVFNVSPAVRRCSNVIVLWNNHDGDMIKAVARKMGLDPDQLNHALQTQCVGPHDSLWIDFTDNTPAPFRKNGFEPIML